MPRRRRRPGMLGALVLVPLILGGCGTADRDAVTEPAPDGESWILVAAGEAPPPEKPKRGVAPQDKPHSGFLPFPAEKPAEPPHGSACSPTYPQALEINSASVVTGTTSGTVTWWNPGGHTLREYRLTAISQDLSAGEQRDVGWTVITPGDSCGYLSATLTGLDRRTPYVFSVDAVTTVHGRDGTRAATVARSRPISTK